MFFSDLNELMAGIVLVMSIDFKIILMPSNDKSTAKSSVM